MSDWFEEKPSKSFRERVEQRAAQLIDNRAIDNRAAQANDAQQTLRWGFLAQLLSGVSVAGLIGYLLVRRNSNEEVLSENGSQLANAPMDSFLPDSLAFDLLEESNLQVNSAGSSLDDVELLSSLQLDLDLYEDLDILTELSEDDLTGENV